MEFITLTGTDNNILIINVAAIAYLRPGSAGGTLVHTTGGEEVVVAETIDVVTAAISIAQR